MMNHPLQKQPKMKLGFGDRIFRIFSYVLTIAWVVALIFPLYWLVVSATKDPIEAMANPPSFVPVLPKEYVITLDPNDDQNYTEDDFLTESIIVLWMTADRSLPLSAHSYSTVLIKDKKIIAKATLKEKTFKKNKFDGLFAGSVSQETILKWKNSSNSLTKSKWNKLVKLLHDDNYNYGLNLNIPKQMNDKKIESLSEFYIQVTDPSSSVADYERINIKCEIGKNGYSYTNNFWGVFSTFINAWNMFAHDGMSFADFLFNSAVVAFAGVALQLIFSAACGYALSKLINKKIGNMIMIFIITTVMMPGIVNLIPMYTLIRSLGLMNNLLAVIIPGLASPVAIILFKGYFDAIPKELREAAKVDGAREIYIYSKIILPMCLPVFGVISILTFTGCWNDFFWPKLVLEEQKVWTFPIVIQRYMSYSSGTRMDVSLSLAMSTIATIPTFILFAFFQKQMTKGLVFSGIKG